MASISNKYFYVSIENDSFRIIESDSKLKKRGSALSTLRAIADVLNKNLRFAGSSQESYSTVSLEGIYKILSEKAVKINEEYREKSQKLNWFYKIILKLTGKQKELDSVQAAIENRAFQPKVFPTLPKELVQNILSSLPISDLKNVSLLNRDGKVQAAEAFLPRAREFGYQGKNQLEAEEYIKKLFKEVHADVLDQHYCGVLSKSKDPETILQALKHKDIITILELLAIRNFLHALKNIKNFLIKLFLEKIQNIPQSQREADVQLKKKLWDVLRIAAMDGDIPLAEVMVQYGADPNVKNVNGVTPLMYACSYQKREMVHFLITHGADLTLVSNRGHTALTIAEDRGNQEIVQILMQHVRD